MLEDIERIRVFLAGHDRNSFAKDEKTHFAVSYAFVRLGEAVFHIPEAVKSRHPEVAWTDVRAFRNFMIHVYHAVDPARVFDTAEQELDSLEKALRNIVRP